MMVTPLPEAHFHYADFPALAGPMVAFGALSAYDPAETGVGNSDAGGDTTYGCVTNLELEGCHFQNGTFSYESGGPQGRAVNLHNTIFERSFLELEDLWHTNGDYQRFSFCLVSAA
jgi:hypothetical protein